MAKKSTGKPATTPAKKVTQKEARELVRQANEAVYGPGPGDFVSKLKFPPSNLVERLWAIDWFVNCGKPYKFDLTMTTVPVKTWPQAMKAHKTREWSNGILEARNQLGVFLFTHHRERRDWGPTAKRLKKEVIFPLQAKVWEPFQKRNALDIKLIHSLQWNVLMALLEDHFRDTNHHCYFCHELLIVYEAGHLPCGWIGQWPEGQLVVF